MIKDLFLKKTVTTRSVTASRGLSAGSSGIARSLDSADKPWNIGVGIRPEPLQKTLRTAKKWWFDLIQKQDMISVTQLAQAALIGLVYLTTAPSTFAATDTSSPSNPSLDQLPKYVINLGSYLGFNLSQEGPSTPSSFLFNPQASMVMQQKAMLLFLGTVMIPKAVDTTDGSPLGQFINQSINTIFKTNNSTPGTGSGTGNQIYLADNILTNSNLIDQYPLQPNPVSQFIVNVLTTPDFSFCATVQCNGNNGKQASLSEACCGRRTTSEIGFNVIGPPPQSGDVGQFLTPADISELSGNTLIEPLLYSAPSNNATPAKTSGLPVASQVQAADNFIRFASEAVAPFPRTSNEVYSAIYNLAYNINANSTQGDLTRAANAQASLSTYLAQMRAFAAQSSVGVGNLYSILAKRLPQSPDGQAGSSTGMTSEALNEYHMATRRLHDPSPASGKQWVEQINSASSASVEKEIAILLSEINYQLYLSRQQQERLLLTNSIMLFQLSHMTQPPPLQPPNQ